ncbi:hypothetical protein ES703_40183 [subsurface metagenome]
MKSKKLVIALGLVALLLVTGSIVGCSQPSSSPETHRPANPLEDIPNPDDSQGEEWHGEEWKGKLSDIPGYPEGMPVAYGIVRKVTSNTLDLETATGPAAIYGSPSGAEYEPGTETKMIQVVFNPDTKVYKQVHRVGVAKPELKELTLDDLSEGQLITVWGEETGDRIFADTIII